MSQSSQVQDPGGLTGCSDAGSHSCKTRAIPLGRARLLYGYICIPLVHLTVKSRHPTVSSDFWVFCIGIYAPWCWPSALT